MNIDYPNNQNSTNVSKPNYSNQTEFDPSKTKSQRAYYGNDNAVNYYPNSNSGVGTSNKAPSPNKYPNSNKSGV